VEEDDKVTALESGADDFLLKPISPRELLVRLAAILRAQAVVFPEEHIQTLGVLSLYRDVMEISVGAGAEPKKLSPKEFNLLGYLMDNPGHVFSKEELLESVWVPWEVDDRRVRGRLYPAPSGEDRSGFIPASLATYAERSRIFPC
jgi:two-component system, OmpR family, phosphate regulon response regulator PhoB